MNWKECKNLIRKDLNRMPKNSSEITIPFLHWGGVKWLIINVVSRQLALFRLLTYLQTKTLYKPIYMVLYIYYRHLSFKTGIQIPVGTKIGGGFKIHHFSSIVINRNAVIGENCTIFNNTTVGAVLGAKGGNPIIEDRVVICTGAKVIGNITIGHDSIIGANAVVTKTMEADSVIVGVPAKCNEKSGKKHVELYIKHC